MPVSSLMMKFANTTKLLAVFTALVSGSRSNPVDVTDSSAARKQCAPATFAPLLPHISVLQVTANPLIGYSITGEASNYLPPSPDATIDFCNVTVVYTHPSWDDHITVYFNLPLNRWNGRFVATGGGGLLTGPILSGMQTGVYHGYATAGTDGGHIGMDVSWAIRNKKLKLMNYPLLVDFATESLKDMALIGKQVVRSYYGQPAKYTYWAGCSTGGRQGLMMAQRYSHIFDGIVANSPAINWSEFQLASLWPQVVMSQSGIAPPPCVMGAFTYASIKECDILDGLTDGIIDAPGLCSFDPQSMVGQNVDCNGTSVTITKEYAFVVREILRGPFFANGTRLWYGLNPGTNFLGIAGTKCAGTATNCTAIGASISASWLANFVAKDATYNLADMTYEQFYEFYAQSRDEYDWIIATNNADLQHLRQTGTKVLTFHGLSDPLIFPNGTVNYYQRVLATDAKAADYYRFFEAPGVEHCGGGSGGNPSYMFDSLVDWVEHGRAPTQLDAVSTAVNGTARHHPLCAYPLVSAYQGGDPNLASSYTCSSGFATKAA